MLQKTRQRLREKKAAFGPDPTDRQAAYLRRMNRLATLVKDTLKEEIDANLPMVRQVRQDISIESNTVAVFDSNLTRCLGMREDTLNEEMLIVKVYYFSVAESIIKNGFYMNGQKYVFFSASAGQIRTKKFVAVREDLLNACWNTLTCGLTVAAINEMGGVNVNKYLAYLALCNSATDPWAEFDIDKCIVVEDLETNVPGTVDYIDVQTYTIERRNMDVPITHTDGCGMILPSCSRKNFMCRAPWVKGLLSPFPFDKFIREANRREPSVNHGLVTDIYGQQHDILAEGIQVIFTKSQFKMWKYYSSWDEYRQKFKQYGCSAGKCNVEEDYIPSAKFNYQMLQTLVDMTDEELGAIAAATNLDLANIATDRATMLKVFGAVEQNPHKNAFQECLYIYPELLQDVYTRDVLRDIKKSMEKEGRAARLSIDGRYCFLVPDFYGVCEHLFLGIETPQGLLKNGEVYCRLYAGREKLDCLRSPHLMNEHCVRRNVVDADHAELKRWFVTDAIYTSMFDHISKVLQFDWIAVEPCGNVGI